MYMLSIATEYFAAQELIYIFLNNIFNLKAGHTYTHTHIHTHKVRAD